MFGASFFTPGASSSQPPPQKMPNAPASDHTNEESIVSLFQALRNQLGQDLRSITSNEIEVISIRWTFSRVTPSYLPAMSQSFGSYRKYWMIITTLLLSQDAGMRLWKPRSASFCCLPKNYMSEKVESGREALRAWVGSRLISRILKRRYRSWLSH